MTAIEHVTLNTGHSRRSYADEVSEEALTVARELLADALSASRREVEIPALAGCRLSATADGPLLIATVWGPPTELRGSGPVRPPLVTYGVALRAKPGARLWRMLHQAQGAALETDPDVQPPAPWVAARIEVGVALLMEAMPDLMMDLADFGRVLAWAWATREQP